ncbi:unnamed protein product, partial [Mesorhabditis belari]|uniref:C-type lectin domain-containing protein n=1 Tax=Mesorhabditis belari TaxID=2138241 RepID=A0AAF3J8P7_9BILA
MMPRIQARNGNILGFLLISFVGVVFGQGCPPGTVDVPGRPYCVHFTPKMTFSDAQAHCESYHGILAQPIDIYDDRLIGLVLQNYTKTGYAWVGAVQGADGILEFVNGGEAGTKHQVFGIYPFCAQNAGGFTKHLQQCIDSRGSSDPCDNYINRMECGIETVSTISKQPIRDAHLVQAFVQSFHNYINPSYLNRSFGEDCETKFTTVLDSDLHTSQDQIEVCILLHTNGRWYFADCAMSMSGICMMPKIQSCPQGWSYLSFSNACYKVVNAETAVSQPEAESLCEEMNGMLVSLTSTQEILSLLGMVLNTKGSTNDRFWTGLSCQNGAWEWSDGSPFTFDPFLENSGQRKKRDLQPVAVVEQTNGTVTSTSPMSNLTIPEAQCETGAICTLNPTIASLSGAPVFGYTFACDSFAPSNNYICKIQM